MAINKINLTEGVDISTQAIVDVLGDAIIECYGVVGLSESNTLRDGVDSLLGRKNYNKGITVALNKKKGYDINVNIIVAMDTKITEVISLVRDKIKFIIKKTFNIEFDLINVYVQGVKDSVNK